MLQLVPGLLVLDNLVYVRVISSFKFQTFTHNRSLSVSTDR